MIADSVFNVSIRRIRNNTKSKIKNGIRPRDNNEMTILLSVL